MRLNKEPRLIWLTVISLIILYAPPVFADEIQRFLDGSSGFLVKTVGSGVFALGLAVAGIKIAGGDQGGIRNAVMVMIGGAVIFLAKPLVEILKGLANTIGR